MSVADRTVLIVGNDVERDLADVETDGELLVFGASCQLLSLAEVTV